jgi:hypothetical protein
MTTQKIVLGTVEQVALATGGVGEEATPISDTNKLPVTTTGSSADNALIGAVNETAPATDTASSGLNGRLQRIAQRITSFIALVPASLGSKAAASSFAVTQSTEDAAQLGSLTETAPATDTASSGLNGRLQRIAQRITSLIALVPASLGQKTPAASLAVIGAGLQYKLAPAGATTTLGTGATGDYLSHVVIQPTSLSLAAFSILDNAIAVYANAATTLLDLRPIIIPINAFSVSGAWKITMSTGGIATGFGVFTP